MEKRLKISVRKSDVVVLAPGAGPILEAYRAAQNAYESFAGNALKCGQLMLEQREHLISCHSGRARSVPSDAGKVGAEFYEWLSIECPEISQRTAYRWMDAAERINKHLLGLKATSDTPTSMQVEGVDIPLSQALLAPEAELPQKALEYRQGVFDFLGDKTLSEALRDCLDGDSPGSRLTRAANGKTRGGAGAVDRTDYPQFIARALRNVCKHTSHKLSAEHQVEICAAFEDAARRWPAWLVEAVARACQGQLRLMNRGEREPKS